MAADKAEIGARLRAERKAQGWDKPEMIARLRAAAGEDRKNLPDHASLYSYLRRWENGRVAVSERYRMFYARAFGMDEETLFGDRAAGQEARPPTHGVSTQPDEEEDSAVDADYLNVLRKTNTQLITIDSRFGGAHPLAAQIFRSARQRLVTGNYRPQHEREMQATAGETGEIAAWCAYDSDDQQGSRNLTHEAMLISRLAGDRSMELFELTHLALLDLHNGHGRQALRIAEDVSDDGRLSPRITAVFDLRRARALAQLGDRPRALDAFRRAKVTVAAGVSSRDPDWTWWIDDAELEWQLGMLHTELGEYTNAVDHLRAAAELRTVRSTYLDNGDIRGRAVYNDLSHELAALVRAEAWIDAEPVAIAVLPLVQEISSGRTETVLRKVVRKVRRSPATSTLHDLTDELSEALP